MSKIDSRAETTRALADQEYWQGFGDLFGIDLHGFTWRDRASFHSPSGRQTVEIPGWFATLVLETFENNVDGG